MTVVRLEEAGVPAGAGVLARAFLHDPGTVYLLPEAGARAARLPAFFGAMLRHGCRHGEVLAIGALPAGVAIWLPPGRTSLTAAHMAEAGLPAALAGWEADAVDREGRLVTHLEALHARLQPGPHWRLSFLGVEPARQREGLGARLMAPLFERAAAEGLPCYLDTLLPANVPYYERHGFRVVAESDLPGSDVRVWAMRRE